MAVQAMAGYDYSQGPGGGGNVVPGAGRRGGAAEVVPGRGFGYSYQIYSGTPSNHGHRAGFAFKGGDSGVWTAAGIEIASYVADDVGGVGPPGGRTISLVTGSSGNIVVHRYLDGVGGTDTTLTTLSGALTDPDTFYYIEFGCDWSLSAGNVVIKIGSSTVYSVSGIDTGTPTQASSFLIGYFFPGTTITPCNMTFDDVYVVDTYYTPFNDFLGDVAVECLVPTGDGTYTMWNTPGAPHWSRVNALPWDGSSPIDDNPVTYQDKDTFTMTQITGFPGITEIPCVQYVIVSRKTDSSKFGSIRPDSVFATYGEDHSQPAITQTVNFRELKWLEQVDTNTGLPWTVSTLNSMEAGIYADSSGSQSPLEYAFIGVEYIRPPSAVSLTRFYFGTVIG